MNLPEEFLERMRSLLGKDFDKFLEAFMKEPVRALRVNTKKISVEDFLSSVGLDLAPIPFCAEGFYFESDRIGGEPYHHAGAFYVQEPAAMSAVECIDINPDWKILDLCASPGGKSTQAAAKLSERGLIVSNEIVSSRAQILNSNIERLGIKNAVVTSTDSKNLAAEYPRFFDLVIVDAPCSGEGMMRKNDLAISEWSIQNIELCAARQAEILETAERTVKEDGYLLYSTCTFAPEENELQVYNFLVKHPEYELIPVNKRVSDSTADGILPDGVDCPSLSLCRRFYPHISPGEGQFMALLHKSGSFGDEMTVSVKKSKRDKEQKGGKSAYSEQDRRIINAFLSDILADEVLGTLDAELFIVGGENGEYYLCPSCLAGRTPPSFCTSYGVPIGSVQKGRVVPHHNLFMAYGDVMKRKINLSSREDSELIAKYLHGDTIEWNAFATDRKNGYGAVLIDGCAVGGIKSVDGVAKNLYPKGLRR